MKEIHQYNPTLSLLFDFHSEKISIKHSMQLTIFHQRKEIHQYIPTLSTFTLFQSEKISIKHSNAIDSDFQSNERNQIILLPN